MKEFPSIHLIIMKKIDILISYASWGEKYYNDLILSLKTLENDLHDLRSNNKINIFLNLYLDDDSIKKFLQLNNNKKYNDFFMEIKIINIKDIIKVNDAVKNWINLIQERIIKDSIDYDSLGLFYHEFLLVYPP